MKSRSRLPIITLLLIGGNLVAAFGLLFDPGWAMEFGFRSDHPTLSAAFSSLFLHANVLHLLGNMVFLAAVGAAMELATGTLRFSIVYFVAGLAGVAAHYAVTRRLPEPAPLIGASSCVAGCAAYYSFRYTGLKVPIAPGKAISVAVVTGVWFVLQVVGAFVRLGETEGTAYWAHLGGFAAGVVMSLAFRAPDLGQMRLGHEVLDTMNARGPAAAAQAARLHLQKHPKDPKALWELADALEQMGDTSAEIDVLLQLLDVAEESRMPEVIQRLADARGLTRLPVLRRLQLADRQPMVAKTLLESVVLGDQNEPQRPDALLSLASILRESDAEAAKAHLQTLIDKYPLHPATDVARKRGWI